jgi:SAM-dependent methyltransferase/uncharacterized protein YbaR (Trm112 family)
VVQAAVTSPARQRLDHLRSEIDFRAKLARQHVTGEVLLPDYYRKEDHDHILRERIEETRRRMTALVEAGVRLSPFLELGAERGQRALVLVNEFGADGVAADISYHQLRAMEHFADLFGLPKLPLRVCCDANQLPFRRGSLTFVFCYQFLHHFPSLDPIVSEIQRVLADGCFFFDEEPFRRVLQVELYRQRAKPYSARARGRNRYRRLFESFVSDEQTDEADHGVLENETISLTEWTSALSIFDQVEAELRSTYDLRSRLGGRPLPRNALNWLLGGVVSGLCRKDASLTAIPDDPLSLLACPACMAGDDSGNAGQLAGDSTRLVCSSCGAAYPIRDGIIFLIPPRELTQLYPDL